MRLSVCALTQDFTQEEDFPYSILNLADFFLTILVKVVLQITL
jgi:hypothetical protein